MILMPSVTFPQLPSDFIGSWVDSSRWAQVHWECPMRGMWHVSLPPWFVVLSKNKGCLVYEQTLTAELWESQYSQEKLSATGAQEAMDRCSILPLPEGQCWKTVLCSSPHRIKPPLLRAVTIDNTPQHWLFIFLPHISLAASTYFLRHIPLKKTPNSPDLVVGSALGAIQIKTPFNQRVLVEGLGWSGQQTRHLQHLGWMLTHGGDSHIRMYWQNIRSCFYLWDSSRLSKESTGARPE